ncbi:hypothetical protein [Hymenobacter arizonensis]|uniref:Dolichyl-phosphate-mannose-protein mannosyltransferase n=1 Tax=Hymenobacter arizonensis TaxID=1227077 RepID=A0A1I5ZJA0_HYMAR|nr:hypothetical protein [Hymenobacter arizonensis]SFQ56197.1 hypothetical protein SAMN04515668_2938 [Hymenobacter arizonensis]
MKNGRVPAWVWVLLIVAHAVAFAWSLSHESWSFPDTDRYFQAAENLRLHGELYARPWFGNVSNGQSVQEYTIRPLGYPLVVLALGNGTARPFLLLAIQNVLSLLSIAILFKWWAARAQASNGNWLLPIIGVLSFPTQLIYANAVMSEVVLQTVVLTMVAAGLAFIETRKGVYFIAVAIAVVVAMLLKPVFYPSAIIFGGAGAVLAWQRRKPQLALIGLVPVVVMGLYMEWNNERTGYFHFSSIADINLLHYNAAGVVRQVDGPAAEEKWVAAVLSEANAKPDFASRQHFIQSRAKAVIWEHPVVYAGQHLQGMVALFLDPGRFDISQFLGLEAPVEGGFLTQARAGGIFRAMQRLPVSMMALLGLILVANSIRLVLAVRGFIRLGNFGPTLRRGRWLALAIILYVACLTGPLGAARFLVPIWPLLLGLSLVGLGRAQEPLSIPLHPKETAPMGEGQG